MHLPPGGMVVAGLPERRPGDVALYKAITVPATHPNEGMDVNGRSCESRSLGSQAIGRRFMNAR
jgi:hypothetical protein